MMKHPPWKALVSALRGGTVRSRSGHCILIGSSRLRGLVRGNQWRYCDLFLIGPDLFVVCVDGLIGNLTQTLAQAFAVMLQKFERLVKPHHCHGEPPVELLLESATLFQGAIVFEFRWPAVCDLINVVAHGIDIVFEMN